MKIKRIAALLLAALMLLPLCACGSNGGSGNDAALNGFGDLPGDGGADDNGGGGESEEPLWRKDEAILTAQGYNVSYTTSNLYAFEDVVKAESGALSGIVTATHNKEGVVINIYYFKSEDQASKSFASLDQNFKLVGPRIIHGDRDDLIHD